VVRATCRVSNVLPPEAMVRLAPAALKVVIQSENSPKPYCDQVWLTAPWVAVRGRVIRCPPPPAPRAQRHWYTRSYIGIALRLSACRWRWSLNVTPPPAAGPWVRVQSTSWGIGMTIPNRR
jgi:hypothetical protein